MAPLLPKLRGHFAEFLNHSSPERLSILYLTTCVGFGYGPNMHIARGFSRQHRITNIPTKVGTHHASGYTGYGFTYTPPHTLTPQSNKWLGYLPASPHHLTTTRSGPTHPHHKTTKWFHDAFGWLVSLIHHGRAYTGTGISTRYPSTTPVGLALGPDSPWEDELDPGTLSHPADKILTYQSLLMPAFSLAHTPQEFTRLLQRKCTTLPYPTHHKMMYCRGFGGVLKPHYIVGAEPLDQ